MKRVARKFLAALSVILLVACEPPTERSGTTTDIERIVALAPSLTELVFAVGAGDRLVGVVEYSDYPEAARGLPRVGDSFRVDFEALGMLRPDLVLVWTSGNPPEVIERLRELGYQVVALEPTGLDSVAVQMELIGELVGTSAMAGQAAAAYRRGLDELRAAERSPQRSVFWQISANPYFTVTREHIINEIIELCGGRNVFADMSGLAPNVTLEAIVAARPEVIIASTTDTSGAWQARWSEWKELPAVAANHLYSINPDIISRSGPRLVDGARAVCAALDESRR